MVASFSSRLVLQKKIISFWARKPAILVQTPLSVVLYFSFLPSLCCLHPRLSKNSGAFPPRPWFSPQPWPPAPCPAAPRCLSRHAAHMLGPLLANSKQFLPPPLLRMALPCRLHALPRECPCVCQGPRGLCAVTWPFAGLFPDQRSLRASADDV